jgi:hypothetical protein
MPLSKILSESVDLSDNFNFTGQLQQNGAGIGETNKPYFRAYNDHTQNIGTAGANIKVENNTVVLDSSSAFNTTNYRFQPQTAGKYIIFGVVTMYSTTSTYRFGDIYIYKNGSQASRGSGLDFSGNYGYRISPFINDIITLNGSSDYVELYVRGYAGGTTAYVEGSSDNTWFGGYFLSST